MFFKEKKAITKEISDQIADTAPIKYDLYKKFMKEYSNPLLEFYDSENRPNSKVSCPFGLTNGYKIINGKMEWGYVRIHQGIDQIKAENRSYSWGAVDDVVINPFNANRTSIIQYGDTSYGTLNRLYLDEYGFELRVAHMNPDQNTRKANEKGPMNLWSYKQFKSKKPFKKGWVLGSAGSLGFSSGAHTHTEIKSLEATSEVLDILLNEKFSDKASTEYSKADVVRLFKKQLNYKDATDLIILNDYNNLRKKKKVIFLNKHKCQYVDWDGSIKTRYNITSLFNDFKEQK